MKGANEAGKKGKGMGKKGGLFTQSTVVAGVFAGGAGAVELDATDAADVVFGHVPAPGGDGVPGFDGDFHGCVWGFCRD